MPTLTYIEFSGTEHTLEVPAGKSLMQTALDNMVPGIVGDCGGCLSCATCHGYIDAAWLDKLPPKSEEEEMLLDGALSVEPNSRLTCQIIMTQELDGIIVRLPESQF